MSTRYRVTWAMDVDAESHEDAAREAHRELMDRTPGGPTIFQVADLDCGLRCGDDIRDIDVEDLVERASSSATQRSVQ